MTPAPQEPIGTPSLDPRAKDLELTVERKRQIFTWAGGDPDTGIISAEGRAKAQAKAAEIYEKREELIRKSNPESKDCDLIKWAYRPQTFLDLEEALASGEDILVSGANREGKSFDTQLWLVEWMQATPGVVVAFFESTYLTSVIKQQNVIHQMLPPHLRVVKKKGRTTDVSFTQKNGFSEGRFVLPNGSMGIFLHYSQDVGSFEGFEFDKVYFAENVPLSFVQTMKYRARGRGKKLQIIYDFTPKWGFTPALKEIMEGMVVTKQARAPLLPADVVLVPGCKPGYMPTEMRNVGKGTRAVFFHNGSNPLGGGAAVRRALQGASTDEIMIRGYGYARRYIGGAFSKFNEKVHCITREQFKEIEKRGGIRTCVCDGAGSRNWFFKWYLITPENHRILYREWPDYQRHGEWAVVGDGTDWKGGSAQRSEHGRGYREYKVLIMELEGGRWDTKSKTWDLSRAEHIDRRLIDPRFGASPVPGQDETTSIINNLAEDHCRVEPFAPAMYFDKAQCGQFVEDTVEMINDGFAYDTSEPISPANCPSFYLLDDLEQSKTAFREWASNHTEKCALKDVIDCDRYFVKENDQCFAPGQNAPTVICSDYA